MIVNFSPDLRHSLCSNLNFDIYIQIALLVNYSQDSTFGITTGYGLDDRGVGVRVLELSRILFLHVVQTVSGARPAQLLPQE